MEVITTKDPENVEGAGSDPTVCLSCQEWKLKCNSLEDLSRKLKVENENLSQKVKDLNEQIIYLKENEFNFESISEDTDTFKSYTGLPLERFKQLFKLVDPGQNAENMKYYETSKAATEDQVSRNVNLDHEDQVSRNVNLDHDYGQ